MDDQTEVLASLRTLGLVKRGETPSFEPLAGGVSSDIVLVRSGARQFCIKRALYRLKVAAVWEAPIARNAAEAEWFRTVAAWLPASVPRLLAEDPARGLFAMTYLPEATHPVWKSRLRDGFADAAFAAEVGSRLGEIHSRSAGSADLARRFANDAIFEPIRIEPYLRATARVHPDRASRLTELAETTLAHRLALVHGDVSPKNILCGPEGPVFLDAECACFGDPAFDLAFCLNHLLLKGAWHPRWRPAYRACFEQLTLAYFAHVDWEPRTGFERRCAHLLPGLMLARVDGKSPVEYLTESSQREPVRRFARQLLAEPLDRLEPIAARWVSAG